MKVVVTPPHERRWAADRHLAAILVEEYIGEHHIWRSANVGQPNWFERFFSAHNLASKVDMKVDQLVREVQKEADKFNRVVIDGHAIEARWPKRENIS